MNALSVNFKRNKLYQQHEKFNKFLSQNIYLSLSFLHFKLSQVDRFRQSRITNLAYHLQEREREWGGGVGIRSIQNIN